MPYLIEAGVSLLIAQWIQLEWPLPDLIIPYPEGLWMQRGTISARLAQGFARHENLSYQPLLKRGERMGLKGRGKVEGKRVLVIMNLLEASTPLEEVAEVLLKDNAEGVYALALARSIY